MPIIIDGNNLFHSLPKRERNREAVRRETLDIIRHESVSLTVVFDGPPPEGSPALEHLGRTTVRYSGPSSADDVIVGLLPPKGQASDWVVVTDDRALHHRVRERGARVRALHEWRSRRRQKPRRQSPGPKLSSREVDDWETYFSSEREGGDS